MAGGGSSTRPRNLPLSRFDIGARTRYFTFFFAVQEAAARFCLAHRRRWASPRAFRAAADILRLFRPSVVPKAAAVLALASGAGKTQPRGSLRGDRAGFFFVVGAVLPERRGVLH